MTLIKHPLDEGFLSQSAAAHQLLSFSNWETSVEFWSM